MGSSGVSGMAVGIVTTGGLLIYAGIRGVSPLQALKEFSSGKPVGIANIPGGNSATTTVAATGNIGAAALTAAAKYQGDKYSQLNRTQPGYSDCSSFVCKGFHDVGVPKPDGLTEWPTTGMFATSPWWQTIGMVTAGPGDIAVVGGKHMVFISAPGATQALGQQNPTSNVHSGTINDLFAGVTGHIIFRRFVGPGS